MALIFRKEKEPKVEKTLIILNLSNRLRDLEDIILDIMLKSKEFGVVVNSNGDRIVIHKDYMGEEFRFMEWKLGELVEVDMDPFRFSKLKHKATVKQEGLHDKETYKLVEYFNQNFRKPPRIKIREEKE